MNRLRRLFWNRRKQDLRDELEAHLQMDIANRIEHGEDPASARQSAMREFGNIPLVQEVTRSSWGWLWLERIGQDIHNALRQIRRSPTFAATVIGTLALGIGAATAMFTVVDHVLLNPVPYCDVDHLVAIGENDGKSQILMGAPWLDIQDWKKQNNSFEQIAFSTASADGNQYIESHTGSIQVVSTSVSPNFFRTLGVEPAIGRDFLQEAPSFSPKKNPNSIILSYPVWEKAFNSDSTILGHSVQINDEYFTVVGVMPRGFRYPEDVRNYGEVWLAHVRLEKNDTTRNWDSKRYSVIGRLRPGVSLQAASAEMAVIQQRLTALYPMAEMRQSYGHILLQKYTETLTGKNTRNALLVLLAASLLLWLIAAANATNLLLARSTTRQREFAVRGALGASRVRVIQQMLVEGLVLGLSAGALGVGLALASIKLTSNELSTLLPPQAVDMPNLSILTALLGLTLASVILSVFWPAWAASKAPIEPSLRQGSLQGGTSRHHARTRAALVSVEIALSILLMIGCGLLLRTIYNLRQVPLGFRTDHILVTHLSIPGYRYSGRNLMHTLYQPLLRQVQEVHGVEQAGLISEVPLGKTFEMLITLYTNQKPVTTSLKAVSPSIKDIFGLKMLAGRYFDADDRPSDQLALVVNEAFARAYSPDTHNPAAIVGTKLFSSSRNRKNHQSAIIVGVLQDQHQVTISKAARPEIDICINQITPDSMFYQSADGLAIDLAIRSNQSTPILIPDLKDVLRRTSPELANSTITTMDQIVADSYGSQQFAAHLLEIFGGTALLLSIIGLYGLMAYVVSQRTHELGIRVALGATRAHVQWLILRQAAVMLAIGVIAGTCLALMSGKIVSSFLFGVQANDAWTLAGAAILLALCGLSAAFIPARRAAHMDPMQALRAE